MVLNKRSFLETPKDFRDLLGLQVHLGRFPLWTIYRYNCVYINIHHNHICIYRFMYTNIDTVYHTSSNVLKSPPSEAQIIPHVLLVLSLPGQLLA